jgi:two-component system, chemotaxis family, protein-glutamate methylesterase/glutaminase
MRTTAKKNKSRPGKSVRKRAKRSSESSGKDNIHVVVIGGSAGSYRALLHLFRDWPGNFNAAVCVVMHISGDANLAILIQHIQSQTNLICKLAENGETIKSRHVYFAAPATHMLLSKGKTVFGSGPDENRFKPSIDILFRSAAINFQKYTVGIILTGFLDDGVAGMVAIYRCGGICIIQDPEEAEFPELPLAVTKANIPLQVARLQDMGTLLISLATLRRKKAVPIPEDLLEENRIAENMLSRIDTTRKLGSDSVYTCPQCGGNLYKINDGIGPTRYRCFTGHAMSEKTLLDKKTESLIVTLWTSLRLFEEKRKLLEGMSQTPNIKRRLEDIEHHVSQLKALLIDLQPNA